MVPWTLEALPDLHKQRWLKNAYKRLCVSLPRLSNCIFCWGRKPPAISGERGTEV
jgi:hypothetical protein